MRLARRLFPRIPWREAAALAGIAVFGAVVAAGFGVIHDQVTYSISPEYFTRMKFQQFHLEDSSLPQRMRVAWIGVLATWWVGFIAVWFMGRRLMRSSESGHLLGAVLRGLAGMLLASIILGLAGCWLGPLLLAGRKGWLDALQAMEVRDPEAFLRVAGIHIGSYAGAGIGFLRAMITGGVNRGD